MLLLVIGYQIFGNVSRSIVPITEVVIEANPFQRFARVRLVIPAKVCCVSMSDERPISCLLIPSTPSPTSLLDVSSRVRLHMPARNHRPSTGTRSAYDGAGGAVSWEVAFLPVYGHSRTIFCPVFSHELLSP